MKCIRIISLWLYVGLFSWYPGALAADPSTTQLRYRFEIPAQPLAAALEEFARISDLQFIYVDADIASIQSGYLAGDYTVAQALEGLLKETGVMVEWINHNTLRCYRPQARENEAAGILEHGTALRPVLEEVKVTAQKRLQNLQQVPIAVSVISGEQLQATGVGSLQQFSAGTPNLYVAESFVGDAVYVRGIGSGQNNLGFEQAVGQAIDGVFYGRSRFLRVPFLDLDRVEVLKGPQGIMFGKNTTAGVINITTAKPNDYFEAELSGAIEFEGSEGYSLQGVLSGPITKSLRARLAARYDDQRGFLDNPVSGGKEPAVDDKLGRVTLLWDEEDEFDVLFQYQYSELSRDGANNQYSRCKFLPSFSSPGEDCRLNYRRFGTATKRGNNVEGKETRFNTYMLTANWPLKQHLLTAVSGFGTYSYRDLQDGDRTGAEVMLTDFAEQFQQFSQELRLASTASTDYEYMVGLYHFGKSQETDYLIHFSEPSVSQSASRNTFTRERGESYALFGQLSKQLNSAWSITVGGRYTYEKKSASSRQFPSRLYSRQDLGAFCHSPIEGACYRHNLRQEFDEENFSPAVSLQWSPDIDTLLYLSLRRGFKAGGFDHNMVAEQDDSEANFQFDAEKVIAYELGFKMNLLEGGAQLNGALFYSDFTELQLSSFLNSAAAINRVTNAGSAVTQGLEVDLRWQVTSQLLLQTSLAYLDSQYRDYADAPCYTDQPIAPDQCRDEDGDGFGDNQDLRGQPLQFAPQWKASTAISYRWTMHQTHTLVTGIDIVYIDSFPLQADLDPALLQSSYIKINGRLAIMGPNDRWELALVGHNLGNKSSSHYGDDVPLQNGNLWRSVDSPRTLTLQASVRF